jgi:putative transposase
VQTCIVHLIRQSLLRPGQAPPRRRPRTLKPIYTAVDTDQALQALDQFEAAWGERYPMTGATWRDSWEST